MHRSALTLLFALLGAVASLPPVAASDALDPAAVEQRELDAPLRFGDKGAAVLRAQVLLERAHFSPGEIDANFGSNMRQAVLGYQQRHQLGASGEIDAETWQALHADTGDVLQRYRITDADAAGPFVTVPDDMMQKSKLAALGYGSAEEALGEKFHSSPQLLRRLNPDAGLGDAGNQIVVPDVDSAALPAAASVVVDASDATVSLLDASGEKFAQFPSTMGSEHDPLPVGEWKVQGVSRDPVFHYNPELFWDADPGHSKAAIQPGPNNPVGVVWIDLSKPHYGIHGTPEPSRIGKTQSHGCIRLTNWSASAVAQAVSAGTTAVLQE